MKSEIRIAIENLGEVSAIAVRPAKARWLLVLAHGAGAGMRHPFMEAAAAELAAVGVATLRYQFPYMEQGRRIPDRPGVLTATVRAAVRAAKEAFPELPLLAGGKSLGARMTSTAAAESPIEGVRGLVFFGFPLHAPGKPGTKRADHLAQVTVPMLFLEGTRDAFADLKLLRSVVKELGRKATFRLRALQEPATLHIVETADHSFHVLKSSGKTDGEVLRELAQTVAGWAEGIG